MTDTGVVLDGVGLVLRAACVQVAQGGDNGLIARDSFAFDTIKNMSVVWPPSLSLFGRKVVRPKATLTAFS